MDLINARRGTLIVHVYVQYLASSLQHWVMCVCVFVCVCVCDWQHMSSTCCLYASEG